jgi:Transposase DDE domain group 1
LTVNCGWVLAANIAADLAAWCRLLGLYDCDDLKDAEPGTLRYRLWSLPARLVRHARARMLKISRTWPWKDGFLACWQRLCALPAPRLASHPVPATRKGARPGAVGAGAGPSTSGSTAARHEPRTRHHC